MSKRIWKFSFAIDEERTVYMPTGAVVRHVGWLDGLCCWVEFEGSGVGTEPRTFVVHGTGQAVPPDQVYVGTAIASIFVWHLYEVVKG